MKIIAILLLAVPLSTLYGVQPAEGTTSASDELKRYTTGLPFSMPEMKEPIFPELRVSIADFGAVADGRTLNTTAFANAIAACVQKGGGTVMVPAGTWLTGPIRLESKINLHLERGALIQFSSRFEDFPLIKGLDGKSKKYIVTPPLHGFKVSNFAITGEGIIDGAGEAWRPVKREKQTPNQWKELIASGGAVSADGKIWWPSKKALEGEQYLKELEKTKTTRTAEDYAEAREFLRPNMVQFEQCTGILLDGPTFRNSPRFHVYPMYSENIIVRNTKILTEWYAQNGDGLDLNSCRNVVVYNVTVDAGDDGICIKPGRVDKEQPGRPSCENIVIADCVVYHAHGGFVIGSESRGGARNISVRNCIFSGTDVGLRFKSARGKGGLIEKVFIDSIQMRRIDNEAILFDMYYGDGDPESQATEGAESKSGQLVDNLTPKFQDFSIRNIVCNGASRPLLINGLPEMPVKNIRIENVHISSTKGVLCVDADSIVLKNAILTPSMGPVLTLNQSRNVILDGISYPEGSDLLLSVHGEKADNIHLVGIDISRAKKAYELGKNVKPDVIIHK